MVRSFKLGCEMPTYILLVTHSKQDHNKMDTNSMEGSSCDTHLYGDVAVNEFEGIA